MKKPKIEGGYLVIDALDMLQYVEEQSKREGLRSRIMGDWELSNDSYQRPWNIELKYVEKESEYYSDLKAIFREFPELKEDKTLLWTCW